MNVPQRIQITEVGPRDGLQMEKRVLPTRIKVDLIGGLVEAGVSSIQVGAFVHPRKIPQMADTDALAELLPVREHVHYSALTLNLKGVERACRTSIAWIEVSLSASDAHGRRNAGLSLPEAIQEAGAMVTLAARAKRRLRASIQCAFGYTDPLDVGVEQVVRMTRFLVDQGIDLLVLADTAGMATPQTLTDVLAAVIPQAGTVPVGLHLHDTRGFGALNVRAALQMGIIHFDTALGGLGGCPFLAGASGNIATESTVRLIHGLGIDTGIDAAKVAVWSRRLNRYFGRALPAGTQ
ncbi:MAG: hydroxymethylglutaryl-CoA lyase [Desulfobacteraceae bacterium]|nr:MAG: hydroxymethylglutaryl-CoA lyase [Desulfobacteraceae bacterium]